MSEPAPAAVKVAHRLQQLERELMNTYQRLGVRRTPLPPLRPDDPRAVELRVQWVEKELRWLERLLRRQAGGKPRRSLRQRLAELSPSRLSARIAQLGLVPPPEEVDEFGADHRVYEQIRPWVRFLFEDYWRVAVEGIHHLPTERPGLLVANHAGLLPFDALMMRYAIEEMHPAGRVPRFLIEDWFMRLPAVNLLLQRLGAIRGSQDNARRLLELGSLVGLFPEGAKGVAKPYRDRYRVQRFGRGGVIRLALRHQVPVVPVGIVGSEEIYPVLLKPTFPRVDSELDFLPITPLFPHGGPLGFVPLPSKWRIRFGEPMEFSEFPPETADDEITVNTLNEELRQRVQDLVNAGLQSRRSTWLG